MIETQSTGAANDLGNILPKSDTTKRCGEGFTESSVTSTVIISTILESVLGDIIYLKKQSPLPKSTYLRSLIGLKLNRSHLTTKSECKSHS